MSAERALAAAAAIAMCLSLAACGGAGPNTTTTRTVTVTRSVPVPAAGPTQSTSGAKAQSGPDLIAEAEARHRGKPAAHLNMRRAMTRFASCMRANGVNYPAPTKTANGLSFDTKGLDETTSQYKAANAKCSRELESVLAN